MILFLYSIFMCLLNQSSDLRFVEKTSTKPHAQ